MALLLSVGILSSLALLVSAFSILARLERAASARRVHASRALLLARSGLEDALARLDAGQDPEVPDARYGGEDWDGDGFLDPGPEEQASEVCRPGRLDTESCPVPCALRPSFFQKIGLDPRTVRVDGRHRGISGGAGTGTYALRIRTGGIFVNGGDPSLPPSDGYNAVLRRMLGTLAEAVDREDGANDALPVDEADGHRLVDARPAPGWRSIGEIRDLALLGNSAKADALEPYLALEAWVDRKVIRPNTMGVMIDRSFRTWADLRLGKWLDTGSGPNPVPRTAPDFERLNGAVVGRAPVDLPWARRRRPVLLALLAGLRGVWLNEKHATNGMVPTGHFGEPQDVLGSLCEARMALDWSSPTDNVRRAAAGILSHPGELGTWAQWDALCDGLALSGTDDPARLVTADWDLRALRSILKANFNPNSDLNKFNPDASLSRGVDKSDLLAYSTEFSLGPSGAARIEVVGRVVDPEGRLLASRILRGRTLPWRRVRLTAQSEFVAGDLGRLDLAGDEGAFRAYGAANYISHSLGVSKTFGHALLGGSGMSLQTAPEPHAVWSGGAGAPAAYDGQVRLATVETANGEGGPVQTFLARWEDGFDASAGGGAMACSPDADHPAPDAPLWSTAGPGCLNPDGIYVEDGRTPGYEAAGNMAASRGVVSFWLKPNYDLSQIRQSPHGYWRRHLFLNNTRVDESQGPEATACFTLGEGDRLTQLPTALTLFWESDYQWDVLKEQVRQTPPREILPHRWYLLTAFWDMEPPSSWATGEASSRLLVDRGLAPHPGDRNDPILYNAAIEGPAVDFTAPTAGHTTAMLHLGRRGLSAPFEADGSLDWYGAADATFDEFAIYDFGPNAGDGIPLVRAEALALARFEEGRYYKESTYTAPGSPLNRAGEYVSAPLALGDVRVRSVSWTQIVPPGLGSSAPVPDNGKPENWDPGPEGRILLELLDASGAGYAEDASGAPVDLQCTAAAGHAVGRRVREPFRLHAVFQPNLDPARQASTAVLDPLALDDVTVIYGSPDGPELRDLSWE